MALIDSEMPGMDGFASRRAFQRAMQNGGEPVI